MPPIPARALARHLRSLDPAERASFVADLWAARGYETAVEGSVVVAERALDGTRQRILCDRSGDIEAADAVIAPSGPEIGLDADVRVIDAAALRGMLLYAVDRATAAELVEAHLGRPLLVESGPPRLRDRLAPASSSGPLVAVVAALLVAFVAFGAAGGTFTLGDGGQSVESAPVPPDGPATAASPIASDVTIEDPPSGGGDLFRYPPGLGPSGVRNASALAEAHRTALAATAWELRLRHNRSHDLVHPFRRWHTAEQSIVRANASRYRFEVSGEASLQNGSVARVSYVDYGDGSANYRRLIGLHGNAYERTRLPTTEGPGVFAAVSAAYVDRYLETTETRVEPIQAANTTRTRVIATGTPTALARTVANYTAVAVVDRRGVVRELTVSYTLLERAPNPTPNGIATPYASPEDVPTQPVATVRFTMWFAPIEAAALTAPSWYDAARNVTNGTALDPWPNDPAV